jgi:serine/threonine-protein kinase RsbW
MATTVTLRIPSQAEYVAVARLTVAGIAGRMGFPYDAVDDIKVAVGEACTNAIEHAAPDPSQEVIEIRCQVDPEALIIEIADQGKGFDPGLESQPDLLAGGGLGLILIRALMDEVQLDSLAGKGTQVRMIKRLKPAPLTPAR